MLIVGGKYTKKVTFEEAVDGQAMPTTDGKEFRDLLVCEVFGHVYGYSLQCMST